MAEPGQTIRLDKWLWQARFCKSRALAAKLIAEGVVRVNAERVQKPATALRVGDGVSFAVGGRVRVIRVLALGTRRGPAAEARLLYADLDALTTSADGLEPGSQADK
jgi:ribosome-associated heat shock protein Hsp15